MKALLCILLICLNQKGSNNSIKKEPIVIGFYNLENLYDTIDNPIVNDDEFIPKGAKRYNGNIYRDKLFKLATVLSDIGKTHSSKGASIVGVAEIENDTVLLDLTHHFLLYRNNWKFIHYDSRDARGVDVALFYNPKDFFPNYAKTIEVVLPGRSKESATTRDILYVKGQLKGECIHVLVNHWPSRRGGEERSAPARAAAANECRKLIDSIQQIDHSSKIILMGDLNDNPPDKSIRKTLNAVGTTNNIKENQLYNPWEAFYKKGMGTLANRDVWGLFDQILLSASFADSTKPGLHFKDAHIYSKPFMTEPEGKFKGYPMRTWDGNSYRGGFSDHFPTYAVLEKTLK
jgi:exonuclease III